MNQPSVAQVLRRFFLTDGSPQPQLDDTGVSIVAPISGPLNETPFGSTFRLIGGGFGKTPAAGEFAYMGVRAQASTVLQIMQIVISNEDAAVAATFAVRQLTAANVTTVGVDSAVNMLEIGSGSVGTLSASNAWAGTHAAQVGVSCGMLIRLAPNSVAIIQPPQPFCLWGNDSTGAGSSIAVAPGTVDVKCVATFICREYPISP